MAGVGPKWLLISLQSNGFLRGKFTFGQHTSDTMWLEHGIKTCVWDYIANVVVNIVIVQLGRFYSTYQHSKLLNGQAYKSQEP